MDNKQKQIIKSVAAIVLCGAFLWAGKKFIWNNAVPQTSQPDPGISSELDPGQSDPGESSLSDPMQTDQTQPNETVPGGDTTGAAFTDSVPGSSDTPGSSNETRPTSAENTQSSQQSQPTQTQPTQTKPTQTQPTQTQTQPVTPGEGFVAAPDGYFADALFIGDSRMVGIASYAPFDGADYFASTGLATYKVANAKNEVGSKKDLTFSQLLSSRTFGKVYIMLGINEVGNSRSSTIQKYQELVSQIQAAQPNALIYLNANLHVTASRSSKGDAINNANINSLNDAIKGMCNGSTVIYLDINTAFDDENGAFRADYTRDGVHPMAKYYKLWAEWFTQNVIVK